MHTSSVETATKHFHVGQRTLGDFHGSSSPHQTNMQEFTETLPDSLKLPSCSSEYAIDLPRCRWRKAHLTATYELVVQVLSLRLTALLHTACRKQIHNTLIEHLADNDAKCYIRSLPTVSTK
jgi:ketopantoate reductase